MCTYKPIPLLCFHGLVGFIRQTTDSVIIIPSTDLRPQTRNKPFGAQASPAFKNEILCCCCCLHGLCRRDHGSAVCRFYLPNPRPPYRLGQWPHSTGKCYQPPQCATCNYWSGPNTREFPMSHLCFTCETTVSNMLYLP